ncbi:hydantoinase B/oxoprolinase family protein [Lacisediminimonas sp.]|uniref:hydantoinase B/oxoprolinase family protein n=1 Tax=Lacisediminimonas sp. TaxID=3060582 RepID=UPI002724C1D0|nr:hydantoinase B/oxoprolinase family protein [Lacisediminimonas sp.]MDO8301055.1 hydantoinase B/oxoprolinase family protein [Lacisediminimonas sp.]
MDTVTISVVRGALEQIANEMDMHVIRAAISPIISEMNDCANGIFNAVTGETIAQGQFGLPVFLANMQFMVQRMNQEVAASGGWNEGDVWMTNSPYFGGTHLPDVTMVAPYFRDGKLLAILATTGHMIDIGGSAPGGFAPNAKDIHQEGIFIPPLKLVDRGVRNEGVMQMVLRNLRLPAEVGGDLRAMNNVFDVARQRLDRVLGKFGEQTVAEVIDEMVVRSERQMRSYIEEIPDGEYHFEDYLDNDGVTDAPIKTALTIRVAGADIEFDFTGTAPPSVGPMNLSRTSTMSMCYVALKHIFPDVPVNGGTFRAVKFNVPEHCVFSAQYPTPVGGYLEVAGKVVDLVFGALAQAIPQRTPAAFFGTTGVFSFGGVHPDSGRYFVSTWVYPGGYGGSHQSDGLVHGVTPQSMARVMSYELTEHRAPVRFERVEMREDSGGAGWHRGGCGSTFELTALAPISMTVLGDRVDYSPFGIVGGKDAMPNEVEFTIDGNKWKPPMRSKVQNLPMKAGDRFRASSPGGGGYRNPLERPVEQVERDLNLGIISEATATTDYGVVIASFTEFEGRRRYLLDAAASNAQRAALGVRQ